MLIKFSPKVEHLKCVTLTPKEGLELSRTMVKLLPGTNEVTDDEWKAMRGNIIAELDSGEISILAQKVSAGRGKLEGKKAKNLKDMPVNLAIKYVSECNNPDTLTKWYKEITNEEVRLAITKKFKKLEIDLPDDEIPDTPNGSPMSLEEFDEDENEEDVSEEDSNEEDSNEENSDEDDSDDNDVDFSEMSVSELKEECEKRGIDFKGLKKDELIRALEENSKEE